MAALLPALAWTQTRPPAFEVASIKPSAGLSEQALLQPVPGRLLMRNFAPRALIALAWGVEGYQVTGGPSWTNDARYDIEAKAEGNPSVQQMEGPMLQSLIQDRFRLRFHRETREVEGYALSIVNRTKLQASPQGSCIPYSEEAPPPLAPSPGQRPVYCGFPLYGGSGPDRTLDGRQIRMAALARALTRAELHRPVVDRTGMTETFDLHLAWTADSSTAADAVSIYSALREQLGLKLEPARVSVDVIVIDDIQKPSAN